VNHETVVTIKVGLSRITIGRHRHDGTLSDVIAVKTPAPGSAQAFPETSLSILERWGIIDRAVIVNVVPDIDPNAFLPLSRPGGAMQILSPKTHDWPMDIDYVPPGSMGVDRIAACMGALWRFRTGDRTCVVADFGTHTVLTLYRKHRILGGALCPGIVLQLSSVGAGRVLSPYVLDRPSGALGRSTRDGVLAGTVLGTVKAVEGLSEEMERLEGDSIDLILTGGLARFVQPYFRRPVLVDRHLVHFGAWTFSERTSGRGR
jgi:type III pantothenate kinase